VDQEAGGLGDHDAADRQHDRVRRRERAGGHRAVPLIGMAPVALGVGDVVDEVHGARRGDKRRRRDQRVGEAIGPPERRSRQRGRED